MIPNKKQFGIFITYVQDKLLQYPRRVKNKPKGVSGSSLNLCSAPPNPKCLSRGVHEVSSQAVFAVTGVLKHFNTSISQHPFLGDGIVNEYVESECRC